MKFKNTASVRKAKKARENVRGVLVVETEEDVAEVEVVVNVVAMIVEAIVEIVVMRVLITKILLEAKTKVKEAKTIEDVEIAAEEVDKVTLEGMKRQKLKIKGQTQAGTGVVAEALQVIKLTAAVAVEEASQVGEVEEVVATRTTLDMVMEAIAVADVVDVEMEVDAEVVATVVVTVVAIVVEAVAVTVEAKANPVHLNEDIWSNATKIVADQIKTSEHSMDYDFAKFLPRLKLNVSCG